MTTSVPHVTTLGNGTRCAIVAMPGAPAATVDVRLRVDGAGPSGVYHALEHALLRGCGDLSTADLARELGRLGRFTAATGPEDICLTIQSRPSDVEAAVGLLGMIIREPRFEDFEIERRIVGHEIAADRDDRGKLTEPSDVGLSLVFEGHPLSRPIIGAGVLLLTESAIRATHRRCATGENVVVAVAGDVDPAATLAAIERAFSGLPRGERLTLPPFEATQSEPRLRVISGSAKRTGIALFLRTFPRSDPRTPALEILQRLLHGDETGIASRLSAWRDRLGRTYDFGCDLHVYEASGALEISGVETTADDAKDVVGELLALLDELGREGPTPDELEIVRDAIVFDLAKDGLDDAEVAGHYADALTYGDGPVQTPEAAAETLLRVTPSNVAAVAREILTPDRLSLVLVGDAVDKGVARAALAWWGQTPALTPKPSRARALTRAVLPRRRPPRRYPLRSEEECQVAARALRWDLGAVRALGGLPALADPPPWPMIEIGPRGALALLALTAMTSGGR